MLPAAASCVRRGHDSTCVRSIKLLSPRRTPPPWSTRRRRRAAPPPQAEPRSRTYDQVARRPVLPGAAQHAGRPARRAEGDPRAVARRERKQAGELERVLVPVLGDGAVLSGPCGTAVGSGAQARRAGLQGRRSCAGALHAPGQARPTRDKGNSRYFEMFQTRSGQKSAPRSMPAVAAVLG
eukprot:SAG31_NODE_1351_length_8676_cov_3.112044_1_plen_181_part_00